MRLPTKIVFLACRLPRLYPVACLAALVLFAGGSAPGCRSASQAPADAADPPPADFAFTLGEGGGFAGRWDGYTVQADGTVLAWSGSMAGENPQPAGHLTAEQRTALWRQVTAAEYFEQDSQVVANVTAFLEITAQGKTHRTSWIPSVQGIEPVTSPLEKLYFYCRDVVREAAPTPPDR